MKLLDCTLRDGGNVVGKGYDLAYTKMMIEGLIRSNIKTIEMGNCVGIGAWKEQKADVPTDEEYLEAIQPYVDRAEIGMFCGWKNGTEENVSLAAKYHLNFLRVGANAGDGAMAVDAIKRVKDKGLVCRYSMMKAYVLTADEAAQEAKLLEEAGLDEITIMDSAGTMMPDEVREYTEKMAASVRIPVAFHGHNNLGLSVANALAAYEGGAKVFDCGMLGMARSAGNCATELVVAAFQRKGLLSDVDLHALLEFEEEKLIPAMKKYDYPVAVKPLDLILGISGTHSSFVNTFKEVAKERGVSLYKLIMETSKVNRKNPTRKLMEEVAAGM